ncbi:helix-turn-helix domain-containing protein [Paraburkholderia phosphatilytica]|uniref:helix-turn-helix domain-containing protein n=1 Tax=Paraburkholderia phosphatilytica TaxID=2282883 RepID=UPI000E54D992|nr:AraC family transcriptional regulator [Paraburkholderia phosphatilytica]
MDHHHATVTAPTVTLRHFSDVEAWDVHDFHQVVLGLDGEMVMSVNGLGQRIDRASAWLVPAGSRHDYAGIGENRQLVLDLPGTSLAVPRRLFDRARPVDLDARLTQLVFSLATHARVADAASVALAGSAKTQHTLDVAAHRFDWFAATQLCAALVEGCGDVRIESGDMQAVKLDFPRIDRWLRAHLAEPLRVADLAAHCGFGMRRFHELFCEAFGETPNRYLQRLRLDTAVMLFADERRSLTDIALDVGFADQSAFTHAFTRRFGVAPGKWRLRKH